MRVKSLQSLRRCVAAILLVSMSMAPSSSRGAQPEPFHGAPASAQARNPYAGNAAAAN
jgi:hypothetical protein